MREIKFRALKRNSNEIVYFDLKEFLENDDDKMPDAMQYVLKDLQQFTGLKDKNGIDIYEGDILNDEFGSLGIVFWNKDDASFSIEYKDIECQSFLNVDEWSEVIGNIYENPELLNK